MVQKVSTIVLEVDLGCPHCYKKIKKTLCKFPDKFIRKLCCKAGKCIKSYEIKDDGDKPPKKVLPPTPAPAPKPPEPAPKPPEPAPPKPPEPAPPKPPEPAPPKPPEPAPPKPAEPAPKPPEPAPPGPPFVVCCRPCYEGYRGGPCYHGYEMPPPPPPCYDGCGCGCGRVPYYRGYYVSRCDYFSEENHSSCVIM
uniref:Leucine-rich repeat extensin-like protein 3 n=1 Tax=Nelumbo nucifera TaxID=4432 RepID=A0A822XNB3_NELNU|nr:TPA_asm: hypothetical protein HUJ06_021698 [Nelumbo nucifera]